jgi:hypothetical protein
MYSGDVTISAKHVFEIYSKHVHPTMMNVVKKLT